MLRIPGSYNWECVKRNNNRLGSKTEVKPQLSATYDTPSLYSNDTEHLISQWGIDPAPDGKGAKELFY
jgi:hypothetical protein